MVGRRRRSFDVAVTGGAAERVEYVDQSTAFDPQRKITLQGEHMELLGLAAAIVEPAT